MKKIHLALTGLNITEVLITLKENALTATYVGTDQHLNPLFHVSYREEKEDVIQNLLGRIAGYDALDREMDETLEGAFLKLALTPEAKAGLLKIAKAIFSELGKKVIKKLEDENGTN